VEEEWRAEVEGRIASPFPLRGLVDFASIAKMSAGKWYGRIAGW
jgi:hypothetical protein